MDLFAEMGQRFKPAPQKVKSATEFICDSFYSNPEVRRQCTVSGTNVVWHEPYDVVTEPQITCQTTLILNLLNPYKN